TDNNKNILESKNQLVDYFALTWDNLPAATTSIILEFTTKDLVKDTLSHFWCDEHYATGVKYLQHLAYFKPKLPHIFQPLVETDQFQQYLKDNNITIVEGTGTNWHYSIVLPTENQDITNPISHPVPTTMTEPFQIKNCRCIFDMTKFSHKSTSDSLEEFIEEFTENATLDGIPDDHLIAAFRVRIERESRQHLPKPLPHESFQSYTTKCLAVFPSTASDELIINRYFSATVDYSNFAESLRSIYKLSLKANKDLPPMQAQLAFKRKLKELFRRDDNLWHFIRDYTEPNHMLIEDLILRHEENTLRDKMNNRNRRRNGPIFKQTFSSPHSPKSVPHCDHCQNDYHIEAECRIKQQGKPKGDYRRNTFKHYKSPINIKSEVIPDDIKQVHLAETSIRKIATIIANDTPVNALFDTGSDVSLIHESLATQLNLQKLPIQNSIRGIGGTSEQMSSSLLYLTINKIKHQVHIYISTNSVLSNKMLLGNNLFDRFPDFVITSSYVRLANELFYFHDSKEAQIPQTHLALSNDLSNAQKHEFFSKHIKESFPSLHSAHPYDIGNCDIPIPAKQFLPDKYIPQKRYRMNPLQWSALKNHVSTLLQADIIVKMDTKFVSNYVIVQSSGKEDRFAIDLRAINAATVRDSYPTRTVQEIFQEIKGSKHISTIDATKAFLSLHLNPSDYQFYGVYTPYGCYCYKRMPFGDINAMTAWQRVYDAVACESQSPAFAYADDMIIIDKSNNIHQHLQEVKRLCETANNHGLKFNVDKSSAGFFREAVKNFTTRALPLLNCVRLQKKGKIELDQIQKNSFFDIIHALTSPETLLLPDFTKDFHVYTDASSTHMGAVIAQLDDSNILKPIRYFSKKFPYVKQAKSSNLLELQAMAFTLLKNTDILSTASIHLYCDNATAIALLHESTDPRFTRYISYIEMFNTKIHKIAGTDNVVADELSRKTEIIADLLTHTPEVLLAHTHSLPDSTRIIKDQTSNNITSSAPDTTVVNNIVMKIILSKGKKNVVPYLSHILAKEVIQLLHSEYAHPGIKKTIELAKQQIYANNLKDIVTSIVKNCEVCQKTKPAKHIHPEYKAINIPEKPFTEISMDHFQVIAKSDKVSILNIIDTTTRLWIPRVVPEESSEQVLLTLSNVFYTYGFPKLIKCDNQSCFRSHETMLSLKKLGIQVIFNTAKHHQGNSLIERSFNTLRKMLRSAYYENNQNLSETDFLRANIKRIAFLYNNTVHDTTSLTPFEHLFGRSGKPTITENLLNPEYTLSFDINELIKSWPNLAKKAHERRKVLNSKLPNANLFPLTNLKIGDIIARRQTPDSKLAALYGPNLVIKKLEYPYIYATKPNSTKGRYYKVHIHDAKLINKEGCSDDYENRPKNLDKSHQ
uniref:RNA-directed DNA polymerase n=1 Tax=Strongyloides stercoralis TaxID=6248 RepID=A0AAF5DPJ3_STRER